jgi:Protein of unknwon function (DUF3310)
MEMEIMEKEIDTETLRIYLREFIRGSKMTPTPLLDHGLIHAGGANGTWDITEAGRQLLGLADHEQDSSTTQVISGIPESPLSSQIGGDHYSKLGHYQPWEVLAHWLTTDELRGYMKGTIIAYLARERDKGGDTDIAKALHTGQLWQEVRKDKA